MNHDIARDTDPAFVDGARLSLRRRLAYGAGVAALALGTALLIAEFVCRAVLPVPDNYELVDDPILYYRLAADVDTHENGIHYTHTKRHARGPFEFADDKVPGTRRVVWVGDSGCFGCGVGDEQTAPFQLQAIAHGEGVDLESINLAVPGYNVRQVREVVAQRCAKLHGIDTIVYYHHQNDIVNAPWAELAPFVPSALYWKYERPGNPLIRVLKRSALVRRLGHTRLAAYLLGKSSRGTDPTKSETDAVRPRTVESFSAQCAALYADGGRHSVQFRDDLYAMAAEAKRQGATFIVVYFPVESSLGNPRAQDVVRTLSKWCADRRIGFIDPSPAFMAAREPGLYADSIHPGAVGQRLIADAVWKRLFAEGAR